MQDMLLSLLNSWILPQFTSTRPGMQPFLMLYTSGQDIFDSGTYQYLF